MTKSNSRGIKITLTLMGLAYLLRPLVSEIEPVGGTLCTGVMLIYSALIVHGLTYTGKKR